MENEGEYCIQQVTCVPFSIIFPKNPAYLGVLHSLLENQAQGVINGT